jgi:hypothetical protein
VIIHILDIVGNEKADKTAVVEVGNGMLYESERSEANSSQYDMPTDSTDKEERPTVTSSSGHHNRGDHDKDVTWAGTLLRP